VRAGSVTRVDVRGSDAAHPFDKAHGIDDQVRVRGKKIAELEDHERERVILTDYSVSGASIARVSFAIS
jgi:hypothetical protein